MRTNQEQKFNKKNENLKKEKINSSGEGKTTKKNSKTPLIILGDFIVNFRYLFLIIFIFLGVFCAFHLNKEEVNYDITSYLGDDTESKIGLEKMKKEFGNLAQLQILITDIELQDAQKIQSELQTIEHVANVTFTSDEDYYKDKKALFVVQLEETSQKEEDKVFSQIEKNLENEKYYIYNEAKEDAVDGMNLILAITVSIILIVLLFTTESYFEVILAFLVFAISILLNMGSNFILGEISYITKSIAVVLQLGLSLDYFIVFMNHYMKEIQDTDDLLLAIKKTTSKSLPEIFASSLTTIAGLIALVFMELKIGFDIGIVLSKGIVCSLITVTFLLPCLVKIFHKPIIKTKHRNRVPNVNKLSSFIVNKRKILLPIFLILLITSAYLTTQYQYVYNIYSVSSFTKSDNQIALDKIQDTFGSTNNLIVLVKNSEKDYNKELQLANKLLENKKITNVTNIGSYNVNESLQLGSKLNYQELAKVVKIPDQQAFALYQYYAKESNQLAKLNDMTNYKITLIDIIYFLNNNSDVLSVEEPLKSTIQNYYQQISSSIDLLESQNYSRFILELKADSEGEETFDLIEDIRKITENEYDETILVGESISAKDLNDSFAQDNLVITLVTIAFISIILLATFRSLGGTILLTLAIEGSILLNFGLVTLMGNKIFFISYIIVSAIQMGATIDYAIVMTNRYLILREKQDRKTSLIGALNTSLPTIATSGLILTTAGFLVGLISTSSVVSSIGIALGTGTLISITITIFILPAILYICDKFIQITTFKGIFKNKSHPFYFYTINGVITIL